jgi:hypothetical protein
MEYRGIQLDDSVKLYRQNGEYNTQIKNGLDEFINALEKNGHCLLGKFNRMNEKVLIDFKCGHEPELKFPTNYKRQKNSCLKCTYKAKEKKNEFVLLVKSNGHELLSEYTGIHERVLIDFKCGHEPQERVANSYKWASYCGKCAYEKQIQDVFEEGKQDFLLAVKTNGHKALKEYQGIFTKVLIDYKCGHKPHLITPHDYKKGVGCPKCTESKGEKIIRKWLEANQVNCITQYKFENKRTAWKYDILIPSKKLIVEVHGLQHYKKTFYNTKRGLKHQKEIDLKKRNYAKGLGYGYIEVDYKEHKPELALERFLKAFSQFSPNKKTKNRSHEQMSLF